MLLVRNHKIMCSAKHMITLRMYLLLTDELCQKKLWASPLPRALCVFRILCLSSPLHIDNSATCTDWLTTCALALLTEATLQQPVMLLLTGVLGDFVEEGADFILELFED